MELQSPVKKLNQSQANIYQFLAKAENWEILMPEKNEHFGSRAKDSFYFQLKGMPEIRLKIEELIPEKTIILGSDSDKFAFYLTTEITELDKKNTEVQFFFKGNFSAVMKMMVKKPLTNFIDQLAENLDRIKVEKT